MTIELSPIDDSAVAGYRVVRDPFNNLKFNVYAVDSEGNLLVLVINNLDLADAQETATILNAPHEMPEPQDTELVEVQVGNNLRYFTAAK